MALDSQVIDAQAAAKRHKRFALRLRLRTKRLQRNATARHRLGRLPEVGIPITDRDIERARSYAALERVIALELNTADLTPIQRVGFDGKPMTVEVVSDPDDLVVDNSPWLEGKPDAYPRPPVRRNTSQTPLDYLFFNRRSIVFWQWVAGIRFAYDWQMVHRHGSLVANLERLSLDKIERLTKEQRRLLRIRPATFPPKKARITHGPPASISDTRLDAMARMGRLAAEVSKTSFYLLEQVVGRERWLADLALELDQPAEFLGPRFAEALTDAADHYGRLPSDRKGRK